MSDIDTVAEAIRDAHNEVVFGESNEEAWRRLAQAAIDALGLTQFWAVAYGDGYQGEECYEHFDIARDLAADAVDADQAAHVVTAWFTGWTPTEVTS